VEVSSDRKKVTLFYLEPLPSNARIEVALAPVGLKDLLGRIVDTDGDGVAGGTFITTFDTLTITPVAGTAISGRVFASEGAVGGADTPLAGVTITVDGAEETLRCVTDAQGNFTLNPCPSGSFFVHIDGRTSSQSAYPNGNYYPSVGKQWEAIAGTADNLSGNSEDPMRGVIFLPQIKSSGMHAVSVEEDTEILASAEDITANAALAGTKLTIPANSLFSDDGTRGGRVGIAPVAPDRLPSPLPPGLEMPLVITIQTDGASNFDRPVPITLPNLPNPVTGMTLPPGAKTALCSFNHDTGKWEVAGPMTVTDDGLYVKSDAGVGVTQPGWHGVSDVCELTGGDFDLPYNPSTPDGDIDNDGIPDNYDNDMDGDGHPNDGDDDIDGDGKPNFNDDDVDGDGRPNSSDPDIDGDGVPNAQDSDMDGDGIPNDSDSDRDGDGIPNDQDKSDGPADVCPVTNVVIHIENGSGNLVPELATARDLFKQKILNESGATISITSEYRTTEYQRHLYSLRTSFIQLDNLPGVDSFVNFANRPQLIVMPDSPYAACTHLIDKVNGEISDHALLAGTTEASGLAPPVSNPDTGSGSAHSRGEAFDAKITGVTQEKIDALAAEAGLWRPYPVSDKVHFELNIPLNIEVVDSGGQVVSALRIGKMVQAGVLSMPESLQINNDPDRFYVRVPGGGARGKISVKVASTNNPDAAYNDDATQIDLRTNGADAISDSLLVVADDVDDDYKVDGISDDMINDRTHRAQLGGTVKILAMKVGASEWQPVNVSLALPVERTVTFSVTILRDKPAAQGGQLVASVSDVEQDIKIAKERYAQIGVRLVSSILSADPPPGVDLSDGLDEFQSPQSPTQEETALLTSLATPSTNDIQVFYVNLLSPQASRGEAFLKSMLPPPLGDNIIVAATRTPFTLGHELGHVLKSDGSHSNDSFHLMRNGTSQANTLSSSKRLTNGESSTIHTSNHAH
jgi:hypothetical protein